jgi:hypothetical protein
MLTKNLPKNQLFFIIFSRMCLDGLAGFQFILKGKFAHAFAILKAHFAFYALLPKFLKKRNGLQKTNYFHSKSVVWQYFVNKKRLFSEIIN